MSMFENQASQSALALVESLSSQLAMLPDADQDFVLGCQMHLEVGGILTDKNARKLRRIAAALSKRDTTTDAFAAAQRVDEASVMVASASASLTMLQVLKDLASVINQLSQEERAFANHLATKFKSKQPFTQKETEVLLKVHASKGF